MSSTRRSLSILIASLALLLAAGCSERKAEAPAPGPAAEPTPAPAQAEAMPPAEAPAAPAPAASPAEAPAAPASKPEPAAARIEVAATKPGLTRIGADKCKVCHKVQFDSWAASKHAAQSPPLDCESCHGPGSEYKTMAVMKDATKAKEAGLVMPGREFCLRCHEADWSDDMLAKVHAHKE